VGGSPLSLTLAARIYHQTGLSGVDTIARRKWLMFSIKEAEVQAALYWRFLDQIDEDLRPLAHPGLILRRIDADVILKVLAGPCGLSLTETKAQDLFGRLKEEVTLVSPNPDGTDAVRHLADLRRFMLGLAVVQRSEARHI
jgi:cellulose synthase operon protein C